MAGLSHIILSSSDFVLKGGKKYPFLQKGRVVDARVIKTLSKTRALLMVLGKKITAETRMPLEPGRKIMLEVVRAGDRPVLKYIDEAQPMSGTRQTTGPMKLKNPLAALSKLINLTERFSNKQEFKDIQKLVRSVAVKSPEADKEILPRIIKSSGLLWESKLADLAMKGTRAQALKDHLLTKDLKALVMAALDSTSARDGGAATKNALSAALENVNQIQLANSHGHGEMARIFLPIPFFSENTIKLGQMLISLGDRQPNKKNRGDGQLGIVFLLSLSNIGPLTADFTVYNQYVNGSFGVESQESAEMIMKDISSLKTKIKAHGFQVGQVSCRVLDKGSISRISLMERIPEKNEGILNLIV